MDRIWYRNHSKSEVIGHCDWDGKKTTDHAEPKKEKKVDCSLSYWSTECELVDCSLSYWSLCCSHVFEKYQGLVDTIGQEQIAEVERSERQKTLYSS